MGLVTIVCGQSEGRELRVTERNDDGNVERTVEMPIQWDTREGAKRYDLEQLEGFWDLEREELGGASLRKLAEGNGVALASWGADVVPLEKTGGGDWRPLDAINYPTTLQDEQYVEWIKWFDKLMWHVQFGGAAQAAYQPAAQIKFFDDIHGRKFWNNVDAIVPLTDYLMYSLTGQEGHGPGMAQAQGLYNTSGALTKLLGREKEFADKICSWGFYKPDEVITWGKDNWAIPGQHDSQMARKLGFMLGIATIVWTGSWLGVAAKPAGNARRPNVETFREGLSFEGVPAVVQKNTVMMGRVYDEFVKMAGLDYVTASRKIMEAGDDFVMLDTEKINGLKLPKAVKYIMGACGNDVMRSLNSVLRTTVAALVEDLERLDRARGKKEEKLAGVGGWFASKDDVFVQELEKKSGKKVEIVPGAKNATETGLASFAVSNREGISMRRAVKKLV